MTIQLMSSRTLRSGDVDMEVFEGGSGDPLLYLHCAGGFSPDHPFVSLLTAKRRVVAPSHPGFGRSSLSPWVETVDDVAHIYLEAMDQLGLDKVDVVGCSIGGWIVADIASKVPERIRKLVLVGAVGVKTGPVDKLDVPDMFAMSQEKVQATMWHDVAKAQMDFSSMSDEQLGIIARNRETLAMLAWEPYMHNPALKHRLHRVTAPVLLLRGESDGLISAEYMARYAALFPHAQTATIPAAGHSPQIEQPQAFAAAVLDFVNS